MIHFPISVPNPPQPAFPLVTNPEQQPVTNATNPDQARLPILPSVVGATGPPGPPGETPSYDPTKTTILGDGATSVFEINGAAGIINPAAVSVSVDGEVLEPGVDYTVAGGLITFSTPLNDGSKAVVISVSNVAQPVGVTWAYLKDSWTSEPAFNMEIAGGAVYDYIHGEVPYYRFVPEPYDSAEDAFYASFVSGVLSGKIAARS